MKDFTGYAAKRRPQDIKMPRKERFLAGSIFAKRNLRVFMEIQ